MNSFVDWTISTLYALAFGFAAIALWAWFLTVAP